MKLELFELNFSGKHFQTLERETSKFEGQIWKKAPPLTPKWRKFNLTHVSSEFCAPTKIKREKTCACPQGTYFNYPSADWDFRFWIIAPFCPSTAYPQKRLRGTWFFKGAHLRCATSFKIIGNTIVTIMRKHFFLLSVWQRPRRLKTEHVGNTEEQLFSCTFLVGWEEVWPSQKATL